MNISDHDHHWKINCEQGVWDINSDNNFIDSKNRSYQGARNCANWYGWTNLQKEGSISTVLKGNGLAKLRFGNCWDGSKNLTQSKVKVYLDGKEIKSANHGQTNKLAEFTYQEGSALEIREINSGIIQFNKFETISSSKYHQWYFPLPLLLL